MSIELEVSRGFARNMFLILSVVGLTFLGYFSSPRSEDHKPLLLSPGLARVVGYQRSAQKWITQIEEVNAELSAILEQDPTDLFTMDRQVNHVYGGLAALQEEMDSTEVPPTLENLHGLLVQAVSEYLDTSSRTAQWVSEPTPQNHLEAIDALTQASKELQHIYENPWLQVGP
jgi:hypothetical protein